MARAVKGKSKDKPQSLIPPDLKRCQAEVPNNVNFMTLGGRPGRVRCSNKPVCIAEETEPGEDGRKGSMSLCLSCMQVCSKQLPNIKFTQIS